MCSLKHGALIPTGEEQFLGPYQPGECDKGGVVWGGGWEKFGEVNSEVGEQGGRSRSGERGWKLVLFGGFPHYFP